MKIGFYGHSLCQWHRQQEISWITKIKNHYRAEIVHTGCALCSEERILFDLKKTKKIDLAIILHSSPKYLFVPSWNRDIRTVGPYEILKKINHTIWKKIKFSQGYESKTHLKNFVGINLGQEHGFQNTVLESDIDAIKMLFENDLEFLKENIETATGSVYKDFIDSLVLYKRFLSHPDLQMSRFYGALIQIDQYLSRKKIPVVHCLAKDYHYPTWFKFSSGITDNYKIQQIGKNKKYFIDREISDNAINEEGNIAAFEIAVDLIDKVL